MSRWEVRLCIDDFDKSKIDRDNTFSLVEVKINLLELEIMKKILNIFVNQLIIV